MAGDERTGATGQAAQIEVEIGKAEELIELIPFELRTIRPTEDTEAALRASLPEISALNRDLALGRGGDAVPERLARLRAMVAA